MDPPEPFVWHQRDAMEPKCQDCGEVVRAEVCDLHDCQGEPKS